MYYIFNPNFYNKYIKNCLKSGRKITRTDYESCSSNNMKLNIMLKNYSSSSSPFAIDKKINRRENMIKWSNFTCISSSWLYFFF